MGEAHKSNLTMPAALEQLGALGSLLIHDMANQMCIISGNATFAQMMLTDPQQLERAIEAISKSGERMSFLLGQCAELRRRLISEIPRGEGTETFAEVQALLAAHPGWKMDASGDFQGALYVPSTWVIFAVQQILEFSHTTAGTAQIRRVRPDADTAFLPGGSYFEVRLDWLSEHRFAIDEVRQRFEDFGLLASFELIRQCGGKLEGFTPGEGRQQALVCVPYVYEPKPHAATR